jgi:3-oxoacyl-[acyl-carrier protein] reductase
VLLIRARTNYNTILQNSLRNSFIAIQMPFAVVTGSSSGIGLTTAGLLVERGYSVVLHGCHNLVGLQRAAQTLRSKLAEGASLTCVVADVSCRLSCQDLVRACYRWAPNIDLWVNNAGADVLTGCASKLDFESKLQRLWDVDVLGTIRLSRLVAHRMQSTATGSTPPSIINISWDQAKVGMEGEPGQIFCTIKAAIAAFTSALSLSVGNRIRVNTVAPGWIQTSWGQQSASEYWSERALAESTLQRWGQPEDVAQTIAWLASPEAGFISGQFIEVNGGRRFYPVR